MVKATTLKTFGIRTVGLLALAAGAVIVGGCEKESDSKVSIAVEKGAGQIEGADAEGAINTLSGPAKENLAPGGTVGAKIALAAAKMVAAEEKITGTWKEGGSAPMAEAPTTMGSGGASGGASTQGAGEMAMGGGGAPVTPMTKTEGLDDLYLDVSRLVSELSEVGQAVGVGNTLVAGYRQQDPAKARELIKQRIAEAQGGDGKTMLMEGASVSTVSGAQKRLADAQAAVKTKQDEIASLENQRTEALKKSDELAAKVDTLKGKEAVTAFGTASESRKGVSLISSKIDQANNDLLRLKAEESLAEGQVKIIENYVAELKKQDEKLAAAFTQVGEQIAAQQGVSKLAVEKPAEGQYATSLTAKADQLASKLSEVEKLETEVDGLLNEAAAAYSDAADEVAKYNADIRNKSGETKGAYESRMLDKANKGLIPAVYRVEEGVARQAIGDLYARRAMALAAKERIVKVIDSTLKMSDLKAPASLSAGGTAADAEKKAVEAYEAASKALDQASSGIQGGDAVSNQRRNAANSAELFLNYAWSQLLTATGDEKGAKEKLDAAKGFRDTLVNDNAPLPALPSDLAVAPKAMAPDAGAAPTSAPAATAPAANGMQAAPATPAAPAAPAPNAP